MRMLHPKELKEMLLRFMTEHRPLMLARLQAAHTLEAFLTSRAQAAEQVYDTMREELTPQDLAELRAAQQEPLGQMQWWQRREDRAAEEAVSQMLELPPDDESLPSNRVEFTSKPGQD